MSEDDNKPEHGGKSSAGLNDILGTVSEDIENAFIPPEVESEIQTAEKQLGENIQSDSDGIVFDPEIHATDKDGNPSVTKTGKYRKKKGVSSIATKERKVEDVVNTQAGTLQAAGAATAVFVNTGVAVFGDEWYPEDIPNFGSERDMLNKAFYDYMESKNISDFPAGVALSIALVNYAGKRFTKPKTRNRLAEFKGALAKKIVTWKERAKNASYFSNGKKPKRKDDTNQEASRGNEKEGDRGSSS